VEYKAKQAGDLKRHKIVRHKHVDECVFKAKQVRYLFKIVVYLRSSCVIWAFFGMSGPV
jgi:hypothetical protein